jgi:hypothetical protein
MNEALPISIRGGEDLRLDISMREAPLFRISGSVTNNIPLAANAAGDGLQPATIFFHLANRDLETPNDATTANNSGNISLAVTKGTFELTNIPPGSYELLARVADPNAGAGLGAFAWGRAIVDVENRDVRDVAITINPAVNVKGTVKVAGAGGLPPNLRVALTPMEAPAAWRFIPCYRHVRLRWERTAPTRSHRYRRADFVSAQFRVYRRTTTSRCVARCDKRV